ncbi:MAG: SH3 domain-containing protein [Myxococcota bacterium]|nr:SH3 domain-containing protein [Myxococcota bacterium]
MRAQPEYPGGGKLVELENGSPVTLIEERCSEDGYRWAKVSYHDGKSSATGWVVRYLLEPTIEDVARCCAGRFFVKGYGCCQVGDPVCDTYDLTIAAASKATPIAPTEVIDASKRSSSRESVDRHQSPSYSTSRSERAFLYCAAQYLGEEACNELLEEHFGSIASSVTCAAAIQLAFDGKVDYESLAIGFVANAAMESDSLLFQIAGAGAQLILFEDCLQANGF